MDFIRKYDLYNQNNYYNIKYPSSANPNATIKTSGCGIICLAFILDNKLDLNPNIKDLAELSINNNARKATGTNMIKLLDAAKSIYNIDYKVSNYITDVESALTSNKFVIVNCDGNDGVEGIFSNGGHYIIALQEYYDKIICFDPGYYQNKYISSYRSLFVNVLHNELIQTSYEAIDVDSKYRNPRFYIIETKDREVDKMIRYEKLNDIPNNNGFRDVIEKLMDADIIKGSTGNKEDSILNLSEDQVRDLIFVYRGGGFDKQFLKKGLDIVVR